MGTFIIKKRKDGQFMFNLKAKNGEIILTSEGYTTKQACLNGIKSVMWNSLDENNYDKKQGPFHAVVGQTPDEYCYFNLKASNGEIIGTSEMYTSEQAMNSGISSVRSNGINSTVKDKTNWWNIF